jgi:hypothetical protein
MSIIDWLDNHPAVVKAFTKAPRNYIHRIVIEDNHYEFNSLTKKEFMRDLAKLVTTSSYLKIKIDFNKAYAKLQPDEIYIWLFDVDKNLYSAASTKV